MFVGGCNPAGTNEVWGGSKATFHAFINSFKEDSEYELIYKTRDDFLVNGEFLLDDFVDFLNSGDISHVDDTGIIEVMFKHGLPAPDVIGPIVRSPIKNYKGWDCCYPKDWFYKAKVIRLNYNEERKNHELVKLIKHGIDTETLKPVNGKFRKYVLWAGMVPRGAKNYPLMEEIMKITKLPQPYEFKIMSMYNVEDYWKVLDETAIFINTSKYESSCCALFEARAKGVATIQPLLLNGVGAHEKAPVQVEYNAEAYRDMILALLSDSEGKTDKNYKYIGAICRNYCVTNASLKNMRDTIAVIYQEVLNEKD